MVVAGSAGYAHGDTIEVVTGRGNVFVLDGPESDGPDATGTGDGTSMLDGIGINSRLVHREHDGTVISGNGIVGTEESIRPYHDIGSSTFVISAIDDDSSVIPIPEFYHRYSYNDGALSRTSGEVANILGYVDHRRMNGNIVVSINDGIEFEGAGRMIVKISNYTGQRLILSGQASDGTTIRIVESPYDLIRMQHDGYSFLVNYCACDPATLGMEVLVGTVEDSVKSAVFQFTQSASASVYHGKCCGNRYITSGSFGQTIPADLVIQPHDSGYFVVTGDTTGPTLMNIADIKRPGAKTFRVHYNTVGDFHHYIYDTLPAKEIRGFSGIFEDLITFASDDVYLVVDSAGGASSIRATALSDRDFIDISGLGPDLGYRISRDGHTVAVGKTTGDGTLRLPAFGNNVFSDIGGTLHLYLDSLMHLGSATNRGLVFDHANGVVLETQALAQQGLYNVHAYVKIPVIGDTEISKISLDGVLPLEYLDGVYSDGDSLLVPVIPTYKRIHMTINEIDASLGISDVLGGTGLHIADSVTSHITISRPDAFVSEIRATAGALTYMIAQTDGEAKVHVRATVSGESEITNLREFTKTPPPPPPPQPRDPLTTWIEVYVNGEIREIDGQTKTQIFFSDAPTEEHSSGHTTSHTSHVARFSYEEVTITDTMSIPVEDADFVEFYFYNQIYAQGSIPPLPPGYTEYQRSGEASASAVLEYASINTSM